MFTKKGWRPNKFGEKVSFNMLENPISETNGFLMVSNPLVSVIIVNWNTRDILHDCLDSIYAQTKHVEFEVIVVDNASMDDSVDMIRREFPGVILFENSVNKGFAAANNQGIRVAKGRYVLLLNSDTVIIDQAIDKAIRFADGHPKAGVIGCRVLNQDMTLQATCFMYPSLLNMVLSSTYLYKLFPRSRFFGREHMTWWDRRDIRHVDVVEGCFMLVKREALVGVGALDERFFMYSEETDWCYRIKQAGWGVLFTPDVEIIHFGGQSSRKARTEMLIQLRLSILQFMKKHYGPVSHKMACLLTLLFFCIRLPGWVLRRLYRGKYDSEATSRVHAYARCIIAVFRAFMGFRDMR